MKDQEEPEDESQVKPEQETQEVVLSFQGEGTASSSAKTVSWQQPMQGNYITICRCAATKKFLELFAVLRDYNAPLS